MNAELTNPIDRLKELAKRFDTEDNCTPHHSERVAQYALLVCRALQIRGARKHTIINACLIHDIGKSVLGHELWAKTDQLSQADWYKVQLHPLISAKIAKKMGCDEKIVELVYYHHIWYNGSGYAYQDEPRRRKGRRIPIGARILAVCDAYDAMLAKRSYKDEEAPQAAIEELRKQSAGQFDPRIVEVFTNIVGKTAGMAG